MGNLKLFLGRFPEIKIWMAGIFGLSNAEIIDQSLQRDRGLAAAVTAALLVLIYAGLNFFLNDFPQFAWVLSGCLIFLLVPSAYLLLRRQKNQFAIGLLLLAIAIVLSSLKVLGGDEGTGGYWIYSFPFVAFFVAGQRSGWYWSLGFLLLNAKLGDLEIFSSVAYQYSPSEIRWQLEALFTYALGAAVINHVGANFESELKSSKASLQALLDNLPYAVWFKDCEGRYVQVNKHYAEFTSLKEFRNIIGKTDYDIWPQELAETYTTVDRKVMKTQLHAHLEEPSLSNGVLAWVETFKSPVIDEAGRMLGTTGFFRDITERKLAEHRALHEREQKFQTLFNSVADAVLVYGCCENNAPSFFEEVNQVACDWLGYSKSDLLKMTPADLDLNIDGIENEQSKSFEHLLRHVDGRVIPVEIRASLFQIADKRLIVMLVRDITARKLAEQQQKEFSAHLQHVREDEKAKIARDIHDEIGGALTAIKIDTFWLEQNWNKTKQPEYIERRFASVAGQLSDALASVRRVITELRPTILDDLGLCEAIRWQCLQFQDRTEVKCGVNATGCSNCSAKLEKTSMIALFRIAQEALTNVSRHSGASAVRVTLDCGVREVLLNISDNGCGLDIESDNLHGHYGIRGMIERAENFGGNVSFTNNGGLTVTVRLPISNSDLLGEGESYVEHFDR